MRSKIRVSEEKLRQLYWESKLSLFEIASQLNCSPGAVAYRMRKYGISRRISGPKRIRVRKGILSYLYQTRGLSAEKIGRIYHCDQTAILRALRKCEIPIRHPKKPIFISREDLTRLYWDERLSTYKIASKYHCDPKTAYKYLRQYGIQIRPRKTVPLPKAVLVSLYIQKKYSIARIAQLYNCQPAAIFRKMKQYAIMSRTISETSTKHKKKDFDGSKEEKAYLIGFRLGDLGVRKRWNLIHVGCGTTKTAQLDLIQKLFKDYGPGWVTKKDKKGRFHINFALNRSFTFLLPKYNRIPRWIMKSQKLFLQCVAGYTDAEGSIGVYSRRARLRIKSYDYGILRDIHKELLCVGIKSNFILDRKRGIDQRGVRHNGNCWGVTVNRKEDLYKLFSLLKPLLRHRKRRDDLEDALQNVLLRIH